MAACFTTLRTMTRASTPTAAQRSPTHRRFLYPAWCRLALASSPTPLSTREEACCTLVSMLSICCPCSLTRSARSWKISETSLTDCWMAAMPSARSSMMSCRRARWSSEKTACSSCCACWGPGRPGAWPGVGPKGLPPAGAGLAKGLPRDVPGRMSAAERGASGSPGTSTATAPGGTAAWRATAAEARSATAWNWARLSLSSACRPASSLSCSAAAPRAARRRVAAVARAVSRTPLMRACTRGWSSPAVLPASICRVTLPMAARAARRGPPLSAARPRWP
mmetsp:Transcript_7948/g.26975  ORF Transcript_7948/g.26975 Transcript_7948/m.26975 type:complete len:280 (-) Transcript_7948:215-1054(-)